MAQPLESIVESRSNFSVMRKLLEEYSKQEIKDMISQGYDVINNLKDQMDYADVHESMVENSRNNAKLLHIGNGMYKLLIKDTKVLDIEDYMTSPDVSLRKLNFGPDGNISKTVEKVLGEKGAKLLPIALYLGAMFAPTALHAGGGLNKGTKTLSVYVPSIFGVEYDSSFVDVRTIFNRPVTTGYTENSLFSWTVTGIQDIGGIDLESEIKVMRDGSEAKFIFPMLNNGNIEYALFNIPGEEMFKQSSDLNKGNHELNFSTADLTSGIYFLRMSTKDYTTLTKLNIVDGTLVGHKVFGTLNIPNRTQTLGKEKGIEDQFGILISDPKGRHYTRNLFFDSTNSDSISDYVVPYPDTTEISIEDFVQFAYDLNFKRGDDTEYDGLKTFFPNVKNLDNGGKYQIFIAHTDRHNQYTFTPQQQQDIKDKIIERIYDSGLVLPEYQPEIIIQTNQELPINEKGVILVEPEAAGFHVSPHDTDDDGVIDYANVTISRGFDINRDADVRGLAEEIASALCGPNEYTVPIGTIFNGGWTNGKDYLIFFMAQKLPPKEDITRVLGLEK